MHDRKRAPKIICLINPRAANSKWIRRRLLREYLKKKLPGEIHDIPGDPRTTAATAREACLDSDIVVAMGGDGTIADVLKGIFDSGRDNDVVLGIIPFGSGNAFRKAFGISKNPLKAIDGLVSGVPRWIDLMEIEGHLGGVASIGATAEMTGERDRRGLEGFLGFAAVSPKLFGIGREEKEIVLIEGEDEEGRFERKILRSRFFDCVVTKTRFFSYSWNIAPHAKVDDGYLDITLFEIGPFRYTLLFPLIYLGLYPFRHRHFKAREIIVSGPNLPVQNHGEFLGYHDRIGIRVRPRAVQISCPNSRRGRKSFTRIER